MKNSPSGSIRATLPLQNISRPAAFLAAKHVIMNAMDATDLKQAQKAIDNYIFKVCEKPLRAERQKDLVYILNWRIAQLRDDGIDTPEPQNIDGWEDPIESKFHEQRLSA
jgi:hypothetical protein